MAHYDNALLGRSPPPSTVYRSPVGGAGYTSTTHHYGGTNVGGTPKERDLMVQVMQKDSKIRVSALAAVLSSSSLFFGDTHKI